MITPNTNFDFPDEVEKALIAAGWYTGRKIDIKTYMHNLENDGYEVSAQVRRFLSEFGGLTFPEHSVPAKDRTSTVLSRIRFHFNANLATDAIGRTIIEDYMARVGADLCVIGEASNNYLTLTMDPTGRVYGGYGDALMFYGTSGREAIVNLFYDRGTTVS